MGDEGHESWELSEVTIFSAALGLKWYPEKASKQVYANKRRFPKIVNVDLTDLEAYANCAFAATKLIMWKAKRKLILVATQGGISYG